MVQTSNDVTPQSFSVWLYEWSINSFRRELASDWKRLRQFPSVAAANLVLFFEDLPPVDRDGCVLALVKRSHESAVADLGATPTARELELTQLFLQSPRNTRKYRAVADQNAMAMMAWQGVDKLQCCRRALQPQLESLLRVDVRSRRGGLQAVQKQGVVEVETTVDVGSQLGWTFGQTVRVADEPLRKRMNLLSLWGVTSETAFDMVTPATVDGAARFYAEMCVEFSGAAIAFLNKSAP